MGVVGQRVITDRRPTPSRDKKVLTAGFHDDLTLTVVAWESFIFGLFEEVNLPWVSSEKCHTGVALSSPELHRTNQRIVISDQSGSGISLEGPKTETFFCHYLASDVCTCIMCDVLSAQCARPPPPPLGGGGGRQTKPQGRRRGGEFRKQDATRTIGGEDEGKVYWPGDEWAWAREGGGDEKEREKLRSNFCGRWEGGGGAKSVATEFPFFFFC